MFISQASKGDNRWWKYLIAILSIIGAFLLGQVPITLFSYYKKASLGISDADFSTYLSNTDYAALGITENAFFTLLLLVFVFAFAALIGLFPIIHNRPAISFLSSRSKFDVKRSLIGMGTWLLPAVWLVFLHLEADAYTFNFQPKKFMPLAFVALLLVPIQAATEEFFFRGFLLQGIYHFTRHKWLTFAATTIVFALAHAFNPEFENGFWMAIPAYLIFSFLLCGITLIDEGLEIPIGIHTGNNLFVALILSATGASVNTPSLFTTDINSLLGILPLLFIELSLISFVLLKLIYNWKL